MCCYMNDFVLRSYILHKDNKGFQQALGKSELRGQLNKEELIDKFIYELLIFRVRVDMTKDEIGEIEILGCFRKY